MRHLSSDNLILHHYGEDDPGERAAVASHLEACDPCRAEYRAIRRTLAAVNVSEVPARGEGYEREVWARLEPRLAESGRGWWRSLFTARRLVFAGAVAALVLAAFSAGRFWPRQAPPAAPLEASRQQVRERILLVAVGDHLQRSEMVLAEIANSEADDDLDISIEQARARQLVDDNRLYRQTAATTDPGVASVLDDLERILIEITHSPSTLSSSELVAIQNRIEAQGLIFKIRVLGTRARQGETASERPGAARSQVKS